MDFLPNFTFDRFIPTASTSLAYRTCVRQLDCVAKAPGVLLLHGPCGTGKTHLLHAIGHAARDRIPSARMRCTTAADLTSDLIAAARRDQRSLLHQMYCSLDVLLIDDLDVLVRRPATQRELAALLQRSVAAGACVLCASTLAPQAMAEFSLGLAVLPTYRHVALRLVSQCELRRIIRVLAAVEQVWGRLGWVGLRSDQINTMK